MTDFRSLSLAGLLLIAIAGLVSGQSTVDRSDIQEWNDVQVSMAVTKKVDFVLLGTLRLGRDISHAVDERIGAGLSFKLGKYIVVAPSYLHIRTQPSEGRRAYENRLSVPVTLRLVLGRFTLSDRNLFERRLRHPGGDSTRYRNKLQLEHPAKLGDLKLNLFVADEVFYDWISEAWVRNRFSTGAGHPFNKHLTAEIYYLRQNDGHAIPGDLHVIGTTWRLRF